jgi:hypothetical protein
MSTFGRQILTPTGRSVQVFADLNDADFKVGGVTIDWATVTAAASASTLIDDTPIAVGDKYLRYGQILTKITASGKFGPYDPAASDGRQTLARGDCFILNETVKMAGYIPALNNKATDHPQVGDGGLVWKARILAIVGTASLAAGPTFANFETAFPDVSYITN